MANFKFTGVMVMIIATVVVSAAPLESTHKSRDISVAITTLNPTTTISVKSDTTPLNTSISNNRRQIIDAALAASILSTGENVYTFVNGIIKSDKEARKKYTQEIVSRLYASDPTMAYVIVNKAYNFNGTAEAKETLRFKQKIGAKVTYDVLAFKKGVFNLRGDGGLENWAYALMKSCKVTNFLKTITCS